MASILLVDSDTDTRDMYAEFIRAQGCTVVTAAGGDQAVAFLRDGQFDLVITEIALPGVDGIALCQRNRATPGGRSLPILVVTALAQPHYMARAKIAGANRILLKPAVPDLVYQQSLMMIERWPTVTKQTAALTRAAFGVALRIAGERARACGDGWERELLTTDDGAPIGALLSDRSGLHIGVNRTATELTGFSHSEMIAKSIWDLLPASKREEGRAVWRWFQDTGRLSGSVSILRKNGVQKEFQYFALADVVRGAHLSVFVPHPFERSTEQRHGRS